MAIAFIVLPPWNSRTNSPLPGRDAAARQAERLPIVAPPSWEAAWGSRLDERAREREGRYDQVRDSLGLGQSRKPSSTTKYTMARGSRDFRDGAQHRYLVHGMFHSACLFCFFPCQGKGP